MRKRFLIIFYLGFSVILFAQEKSGIEVIKTELADTSQVTLSLKIAQQYFNKDKDSSFYYYSKAFDLSEKSNSKLHIARVLYGLGKFYKETNDTENAITSFLKSSLIYEEINNDVDRAKVYNNIGSCYLLLHAEDQAIKYYLKSLSLNEKNDYQEGIAKNYTSIGNLFYIQENYELAKKYFEDVLAIYIKLKNKNGIATSYTNLGNAVADLGDNNGGLGYYKKSIKIEEELGEELGIAINYNNIGDCYIKLEQYGDALSYFLKSLKIANKLNDKDLISIVLLNIADVKLHTKKYLSAIKNAKKSLEIAKTIGELEYQAINLKSLSTAYEALGNVPQAYNYNKQYIKIKDSLIKIDRTNKVELFQVFNELEKTQHTISDLSSKNKISESKYEKGKKFSYFLVIAMVVFGLFVIILIQQQTSKKNAYNLLEYKNYQIKKMHDEIQTQKDYLEKLNRTKDKLFSIIAHDLKTPFNSIQGFTELMIENNHEYEEAKRLKFLKIIKGSTSKASSLLNNLLSWANSQSGNLQFNPEKIEFKNKVSNVISLLEIQAINKDIKIINNVAENIFVLADKNMLSTVLRNLISNAIKFTEVKGTIEITSKVMGDFVEITVKDNGVGISDSDIKNLFNIDVKKSNAGTANERGSGLGLILCKDFIEKHGGKLWVESSINEGSEFKFTLPNKKS